MPVRAFLLRIAGVLSRPRQPDDRRIPSQHGVHDYLCEGNGGCGQRAIQYLEGQTGYTDLLNEAGYECALSGKWHLGDGANPQKGFSFWYTHQKGGGPYYNAPMFRDGKPVNEERYITDVITDEALRFLDQRDKEKPFYLSVHYTAPHSPWVGCIPRSTWTCTRTAPLRAARRALPIPGPNVDVLPGYKDPVPNLQGYFAAVTAMDANVGRLLDRLDAEGLAEDTLVIFTSDNGFNCGHHGIWGKGNGHLPHEYVRFLGAGAVFGTAPPGRSRRGSSASRWSAPTISCPH